MGQFSSAYLVLTVIFLLTGVPCWGSSLLLIGWSRRWPGRCAISRTCWVARGLSRSHVSIVRVLCTTLLHAWRWLAASSTLIVPTIREKYFNPFLHSARGFWYRNFLTQANCQKPSACNFTKTLQNYDCVQGATTLPLTYSDTSDSSLHIKTRNGRSFTPSYTKPFSECLQNNSKNNCYLHHISLSVYAWHNSAPPVNGLFLLKSVKFSLFKIWHK
jgi:hypothetical protein